MYVGDLGKLLVAKGFKSGPKSNKSPNLVTLQPAMANKITLASPYPNKKLALAAVFFEFF